MIQPGKWKQRDHLWGCDFFFQVMRFKMMQILGRRSCFEKNSGELALNKFIQNALAVWFCFYCNEELIFVKKCFERCVLCLFSCPLVPKQTWCGESRKLRWEGSWRGSSKPTTPGRPGDNKVPQISFNFFFFFKRDHLTSKGHFLYFF